jgi:predicted RNA binding protein YcfA (HicA-like mRNA interferase family)
VKLPRDIPGDQLLKALSRFSYRVVRQKGSHVSITTQVGGEHHVTIPMHHPIKPGTLNNILKEIADHHGLTRDDLIRQLSL